MAVGDYEDSLRLLQETVASELPEQGEHVVNIIKYNVWSDPILEQPDWLEVRERLGYSDL